MVHDLKDLQKAISKHREYTRYQRELYERYHTLGDGYRFRLWDLKHCCQGLGLDYYQYDVL